MNFAEKAEEVKLSLAHLGHQAFASTDNEEYIGLGDEEREKIKIDHKFKRDAIRAHWHVIKECDAILVLNYDKNDIQNHIGGNTFLEMGFAHVLDKKIFLLNPPPENCPYITEILAMKPFVINGELSKL